jgi:CRISPR/Cas system-associated exonuclease Cas4 (RecB family)
MEKLTAKQARNNTLKNQRKIESVLDQIQSASDDGFNFISVPVVSEDVIHGLIILGYSISKITDPIGYEFTKVTW